MEGYGFAAGSKCPLLVSARVHPCVLRLLPGRERLLARGYEWHALPGGDDVSCAISSP